MTHKNLRLIIVAVASVFLFSATTSCRKSYRDYENLEYRIDRLCDSIIETTGLPGMMVGIWSEEKGITYVKGRGVSDLKTKAPFSSSQYFRIGSITKTFVITAVLQLVDEGKLSLEETLDTYFPTFPRANEVTLRMLCNMTSGIPNYSETAKFEYELDHNPKKKWKPEELVALIKNEPYLFDPGTKLYYSNTNTTLLGMILEKIEKKKLDEIIDERFVRPLGLKQTYLASGHSLPSNHVHGYMNFTDSLSYTDDVSESFDISWAWAAGGMVSSIYELKSWVEALVDGKFLSAKTQQQRFDSKFPDGTFRYGLGMYTYGGDMWGHNGGLPGYTSIAMHHKKKNITIVIFFNWQHDEVTPAALYKELIQLVHPELGA